MSPALSRADLLRLLAVAPPAGQPAAAAALGWRHDPQQRQPASGSASTTPARPTGDPPADTGPVHYQARIPPRYWRVEQCRPEPPTEPEQQTAQAALPADLDEQAPPPQDQAIAPLLSPGQWQNLWDQLPPRPGSGRRLDLRRCVTRLARAQPLQRLPRQPRHRFSRAVTLILDRPDALRPVWDDMATAWRGLRALLGDELQGLHLPGGPQGVWLRLGRPGLASPGIDSGGIPGGASVVLIGAFGALQSGTISAPWRRLLEQLRDNGHDCLLLPVCPLRAGSLPAGIHQAALDPAAGRATPASRQSALHTLLAALSHTWLPAPARLRQLRQAIPDAGLHTELLAYNHAWVARNEFHLGLRPEHLLEALHQFKELDKQTAEALQACIDAWPLDAGARAIERLQGRLLDPGAADDYPQLRQQGRQALADLARPSMALGQFCAMLPVLDTLLGREPGEDWNELRRTVAQLHRAIGGMPGQGDEDKLADSFTLRQRHHGLVVEPTGPGPGAPDSHGGLLDIGPEAWCPQTGRWARTGLPSGLSGGPEGIELIDRSLRWRLRAAPRPDWAERAWVDGGRLYAAHAHGALFQWDPASPSRPQGGWEPDQNPWAWAAGIGVDEYGLWALLQVGETRYPLRWIPPGEFLMGSPEDEEGRDDDETLHRVRLTQGYWLGETAVTQALWQAVAGRNPSSIRGDALPVENVSWDDSQGFIEQLQDRLPGLRLGLPTEAQWEYACRAGSQTRYWWGDKFDPKRANNSAGTKPDAGYPANPFGLRSMNGNVDEWCEDGFAEYPEGPVDDPTGPPEARRRVRRGGAWDDFGRFLRSASRGLSAPGIRYASTGLRLAGGFDPQAGQQGAGAATADGREQSERQGGGQGHGDNAQSPSATREQPLRKGLIDRLLRRGPK